MNQGRYIFAQILDFFPRYEFQKCVEKYKGDYRVRTLTCWDQFLTMMFGQLTFRESIRSIILCLHAQKKKLYHLGFRSIVARKTLADANERRDWKIYQDFALHLIKEARRLYVNNNELKTPQFF